MYWFCISLLFLKLWYCSPPIVKFYFYCHASFKKITDCFFSVLSRPRFFHSCKHGQKVLGQFCVTRAFSNTHRSNFSPHTTNNVGRAYPEFFSHFQLCIGWGGGGGWTVRKFRKGCTLVRGNQEMTEKYEYCSTVPRTFDQDCELRQPRVNVNFQFRYESFKCRLTLIVFVYNLLMEFSKNNRENYVRTDYVRKCFWTTKIENSD